MDINKAARQNKDSGPEVLRFETRLAPYPDEAKADTWALVDVPETISKKLGDMIKVEGTINGHPFRTPLEPGTSGGQGLRVSKAMLGGSAAKEGDMVKLAILGPESDPIAPAELKIAFNASPEARTRWEELTPMGRRDWIRWIDLAKTPETRTRRISRTAEQLAEGKRRACCVNVNEYMLCRIEESELEDATKTKT